MPKRRVSGIVGVDWPCVKCGKLIKVEFYATSFTEYAECPDCGTKHEIRLQIRGTVPKKAKSRSLKSALYS